jgi:hypothetical protein
VVVAAGLPFDLLLGNDFNRHAGVIVDSKKEQVRFSRLSAQEMKKLVHTTEDVLIPPLSGTRIRIKVNQDKNMRHMVGLVCTTTAQYKRRGITLANSVVKLKDQEAYVDVLNPHQRTITVDQGTVLGEYEPLTRRGGKFSALILAVIPEEKDKKPADQEHNGFQINKNLSGSEKKALTNLLNEFKDRFAYDTRTIGRCSVFKHSFETKGPPIHQNPYRYAMTERKKIQEHVDEMLEKGVIVRVDHRGVHRWSWSKSGMVR